MLKYCKVFQFPKKKKTKLFFLGCLDCFIGHTQPFKETILFPKDNSNIWWLEADQCTADLGEAIS